MQPQDSSQTSYGMIGNGIVTNALDPSVSRCSLLKDIEVELGDRCMVTFSRAFVVEEYHTYNIRRTAKLKDHMVGGVPPQVWYRDTSSASI